MSYRIILTSDIGGRGVNLKAIPGVPGWLSRSSVQLLVSGQVMISRFVGSSSASGSALTGWSLLRILSPLLSLSLSLPGLCCLCLSQNK